MTEQYKTYPHNPPHLFRPNAKYFITGSTYEKKHHLRSDDAKKKVEHYMFSSFEHYGWQIEDWVLLNNHYHIMVDAPSDAVTLSHVIKNFHRFSAIWLLKNSSPRIDSTKTWYNYWDTCITFENAYFARLHYIWVNPVKHRYVADPAEWPWGSFPERLTDEDYVTRIRAEHPCNSVKVRDDF